MATNKNADEYASARLNIFFPGYPSNLGGQCVSLAKWYIGEMCDVGDWQSARGDAKNFGDTLVSQGLATPADSPKRGDIVIWKSDGGGYGHIGVVLSNNMVFEENVHIAGVSSKTLSDGTVVYASRNNFPINASWRKGSPSYYRLKNYVENKGEDMIDRGTLDLLYSLILGRAADQGAVDHYVGHYTTSFVVSDLNNSGEAAQKRANDANIINTGRTAINDDWAGQIHGLQASLSAEQAKTADLANQLNIANSKADALTESLDISNSKLDALTAQVEALQKEIAELKENPCDKPVENYTVGELISVIIKKVFNK